jgi:hypothetical protein
MTDLEITTLVNTKVSEAVSAALAAASRKWETVPLISPTQNTQLVGLRQNTPTDYANGRFAVGNIIANPTNNLYFGPGSFTQNGTATLGSPVVTVGLTSRMYVGMAIDNGLFAPGTTIVSIDSAYEITLSSNASATSPVTITFTTNREGRNVYDAGQITAPFLTYEYARQRAIELGASQGNAFNLIYVGNTVALGAFKISPFVNIDFNGAFFLMDSVELEGAWDDSSSAIFMQNGTILSTWDLDSSAFGTLEKQILWRNIWSQNPEIEFKLKGNGSEFFCMSNDASTNAFACTFKKIDVENFNFNSDSWIATVEGTNCTATIESNNDLLQYFMLDIYSAINIKSEATTYSGSATIGSSTITDLASTADIKVGMIVKPSDAFGEEIVRVIAILSETEISVSEEAIDSISTDFNFSFKNTLQTRACTIGGAVTIDGENASWIPDAISNKEATLLSNATIDFSSIQQALWPRLAANSDSLGSPSPGGTAVLSGELNLDNYGTFTNNSNYTIPAGQGGTYSFIYLANTQCNQIGTFDGKLSLNVIGSGIVSKSTVSHRFLTASTDVVQVPFSGCFADSFNAGDQIQLSLKNDGDIDITVNTSSWFIQRIY